MNFNHDSGTIDTILTLDTSTTPPAGGTAGILQIVGTGGVQLPVGDTAQRPANSAGLIRFNNQTTALEYNNGSIWTGVGGSGSVTSVAVSSNTAGLTVTGSPITSSGTITLSLSSELQSLSSLLPPGVVTRTASGTYDTVVIAGTSGNIDVTNGDGSSGSPTINLATVTDSGTGSFKKITTDTFGRVTGTSSVAASDITSTLGYTPLSTAGGTVTGNITFSSGTVTGLSAPTNASDAATKYYVDSLASGLEVHPPVIAASTTNISITAPGATLDGVTLSSGNRILLKNQTTGSQNGIWIWNGASSALTRPTDFNSTVDGQAVTSWNGSLVYVDNGGTVNGGTVWILSTLNPITVDTTSTTWSQFGGPGTYVAGTGLSLSGNVISLVTPVVTGNGGTGLSSIGTANQILGVNTGATSLEYKTVSGGTGISVTPSAGTLTIANSGVTSAVAGTGISVSGATGAVTVTNTGVTSITGTANQITASASTGGVTLSLPSAISVSSLTLSGLTSNSFLYSGTSGALTTTTAPTNGQLLIGSTGSAPVAATLTNGTGISITNAAGSITIANSGVTSFTQTVPSILSISGATTATGAVNSAISLATQTANTIFAGPSSGGAVTPTFRSLAYADLPIKLYTENVSSPVTPTVTGTNAVAIGSRSTASGTNSIAIGSGSNSSIYGSQEFANGNFATAGDAQSGLYVLRNITTTATATELFLDGTAGTQRIVVPNNSVWTFDILVAARRTDATGGGAGYRFTGVLRKDTTAGTLTFVGTPSKQVLGETNTAWDATLAVDTTNGSLKISATGEASKTIRWVATVTTSEVTN